MIEGRSLIEPDNFSLAETDSLFALAEKGSPVFGAITGGSHAWDTNQFIPPWPPNL